MDGPISESSKNYSTLNGGSEWVENASGDIPPIGAIVGGILGQEAIKGAVFFNTVQNFGQNLVA